MIFSRARYLSAFGIAALLTAFSAPVSFAQTESGGGGEGKIVSTNSNTFLNTTFLGADAFYSKGYTGTRATVANIEGGQIWNGHETLTGRVSQYIYTPVITTPFAPDRQGNDFDLHATLVGQIIGGNGSANYQKGIAYGANLWSGGIATNFDGTTANGPYNGSFYWTDDRVFAYPYVTAMQTGITTGLTTVRADVVNSSWGAGYLDGNGNAVVSDPNGQSNYSKTLDALVRANGTTFVVASGDEGPGTNSISYPASAYNALVVGGTTSDTSNPRYGSVASFSSRGPSSAFTPLAPNEVNPVRASVDLVAPGANVTAAYYGGATGGNTGSSTNDLSTNKYLQNLAGTSVSAPLVSGAAALLVDYGKANFGALTTNDAAINGTVIKAVLMNSADKLSGWNNGQTVVNGYVETTQGLDYSQGAGQLNIAAAYNQYATGTHDVAGLGGGTNLAALGWDYGAVALGGANTYQITGLTAGQTFTATLDWFIDRQYDGFGVSTHDNGFAQLTLELYYLSGGNQTLVARSDALYNNVQHFSFGLASSGDYLLRVAYNTNRYGSDMSQAYGLAWNSVSVNAVGAPEPSALVYLLFGTGMGIGTLLVRSRGERRMR